MKLGQAMQALEAAFPLYGSGHFAAVGAALRKEKLVSSDGRRGVNAPDVTATDGARVILSKLPGDKITLAAAAVEDFGPMIGFKKASPGITTRSGGRETVEFYHEFGLEDGMTLEAAITRILDVMKVGPFGIANSLVSIRCRPYQLKTEGGNSYGDRMAVEIRADGHIYHFDDAWRLAPFATDDLVNEEQHGEEAARFYKYYYDLVTVTRTFGHLALCDVARIFGGPIDA